MKPSERCIRRIESSESERLKSQVLINSFEAAIKSLVLNSIEARSTEIYVKVYKSTLSVIVRDNGKGMDHSDLENVGRSSFTSKEVHGGGKDAHGNAGLYGQTLHAIAMLSHLKIISKTATQDHGLVLKDVSGERIITEYQPEGPLDDFEADLCITGPRSDGTMVVATNLFHNIPVRRKIEIQSSCQKLTERFQSFLVSESIPNPSVIIDIQIVEGQTDSVKGLSNRGRITLSQGISRAAELAFLMRSVYGGSIISGLKEIDIKIGGYQINGFIAKDQMSTKACQHIFINNKKYHPPGADSQELNRFSFIQAADSNNYSFRTKRRASKYKYPVFVIEVLRMYGAKDECMSEEETQSHCWAEVRDTIFKEFNAFFGTRGIDRNRSVTKKERNIDTIESNSDLCSVSLDSQHSFEDDRDVERTPNDLARDDSTKIQQHHVFNNIGHPKTWNNIPRELLQNNNHRVISQIDRKFILLSVQMTSHSKDTPKLVIVDQHACDERIRVEKILKSFILQAFDTKVDIRVPLSNSFPVYTSPEEHNLYIKYQRNFQIFGIEYSMLEDRIILTHVPDILVNFVEKDPDATKFGLSQHLNDLESKTKKSQITMTEDQWFRIVLHLPRIITDNINKMACRGAIMFGDTLTHYEMEHLIRWLGECNFPFQCAHGRPSLIPIL